MKRVQVCDLERHHTEKPQVELQALVKVRTRVTRIQYALQDQNPIQRSKLEMFKVQGVSRAQNAEFGFDRLVLGHLSSLYGFEVRAVLEVFALEAQTFVQFLPTEIRVCRLELYPFGVCVPGKLQGTCDQALADP